MKVLLINGSPRQRGNTFTALSEVAAQLGKLGFDREIAWIGNRPLRGCIACNRCRENPGRCVFDDDVCNRLSALMDTADALVVGSPVYYGQPNGAVMAVLQRLFYSNGAACRESPPLPWPSAAGAVPTPPSRRSTCLSR